MYAYPEPFTPNTDLKMDPRSRGPLYKLLFSNVPKKVIAFTLFVSILLSYFLVLGGLNAAFDAAYPQFRGQAPMRFGADVFDYAFLADDISRGQLRDQWEGAAELFRTPGHPFFLFLAKKVTGNPAPQGSVLLDGACIPIGDYSRVAYLNILMGAFSVVIFFLIVSRFLSNRLSVFLSLAFAFEPTSIWMVMSISSDGLFLFILLLSLFCLVKFTLENKYPYGLLSVLLMSLDALVRPIGLPLALLVLLYTLILLAWSLRTRKGALIGLVAVILFCLPILPWMTRNYLKTGYFSLSTISSYAMFYNGIPYYLADSQGLDRGEFVSRHAQEMTRKIGAPDDENARTVRYLQQVNEYVQDFLKENFWSYLVFHIINGKDLLFSSNQLLSTWQISPVVRLYGAIEPYIWSVIYLLALVGVIFSKSNRSFVLFLAALVVVVILIAGPISNARYRLPLEPAGTLPGGLGFERLFNVFSAATSSLLRSRRSVLSRWVRS